VPYVKRGMKAPRFSSVELRVQAIASRETNNQLLRVPWGRFRKAYEEYPRLASAGAPGRGRHWNGAPPTFVALGNSQEALSRFYRAALAITTIRTLRPFELDGAGGAIPDYMRMPEVRNRSAATMADIWQACHSSGSSRPVLCTALQACRGHKSSRDNNIV
jgi:hypothetical protein